MKIRDKKANEAFCTPENGCRWHYEHVGTLRENSSEIEVYNVYQRWTNRAGYTETERNSRGSVTVRTR